VDPTYGFRRLDPVPSPDELDAFYAREYMELVEAGGRAPEIRRLLASGPERDAELAWIQSTLYADLEAALADAGAHGRLLDVGCGTGDFLDFVRSRGWAAQGVEPSGLASARARERGLDVFHGTLERFADGARGSFGAVTLLNVLEHVPDPLGYVRTCRALLAPGGAIAIVVPNDFSEVQAAAAAALGIEKPWWVAAPDHINYFDFVSLERLLVGEGFALAGRTCNFPMELFLLMGDDYVSNPALGPACHARRKRLESGLPTELRRALYRGFAASGLGRNCVVFARRPG
jgi:SAM-dependent methyltransferase